MNIYPNDDFIDNLDPPTGDESFNILDRLKAFYGLFQENAVNYPDTMIAKGANAMMDLLDKFISEAESTNDK